MHSDSLYQTTLSGQHHATATLTPTGEPGAVQIKGHVIPRDVPNVMARKIITAPINLTPVVTEDACLLESCNVKSRRH
jgi:hypothetical protein